MHFKFLLPKIGAICDVRKVQRIFTGHFGDAMSSARSFSVRVMAAECHRQMLFATFFSTRDFCRRLIK
jgi:hypothetical protein